MARAEKLAVEVWSPLPPQASGVADHVREQLEVLDRRLDLVLVAEDVGAVDRDLRDRYRVISPAESRPETLRTYHVGNSPLHGFVYREAVKVPGVLVLHEWNLHELLLGFAVTENDFETYRTRMRRAHGERGSVAAGTVGSALGGRHWTGVFPLQGELVERSLAVICPAAGTAARASARMPGGQVLHLPLHACFRSHSANREEARARLGLNERARVILAPGLATASKSLDLARAAIASIRARVGDAWLVTVGGESADGPVGRNESAVHLGRVDLQTLGDALLASDIVLALRFPSRGESSAVLMRALAAGRAAIVSSGSTADEDLPEGVVARVSPGPTEGRELSAVLEFLLQNDDARLRMERLSLVTASERKVEPLTEKLADFLLEVAAQRKHLASRILDRDTRGAGVRRLFRSEVEAAGSSLGLAHLPSNVFERLAGL